MNKLQPNYSHKQQSHLGREVGIPVRCLRIRTFKIWNFQNSSIINNARFRALTFQSFDHSLTLKNQHGVTVKVSISEQQLKAIQKRGK